MIDKFRHALYYLIMKGLFVYSTPLGKEIAQGLPDAVVAVSEKERFYETAVAVAPDFIISEGSSASKEIYFLTETLRWSSFRAVKKTLTCRGKEVRLEIGSDDASEFLFSDIDPDKKMRAQDFTAALGSALSLAETKDATEVIKKFFNRIGLFPNLAGYHLLIDAVRLVLSEDKFLLGVTTSLYPAIARSRGVTVRSVERNIRNAITVAFNKGKIYREVLAFGGSFDENEKPTNSEFIAFLSTIA